MSTGRLGAGDTAIQPTIFDAKGDLLTATAGDTPARLAAGNSGETLVADSSTSTGLDWKSAAEQYPWTAYTPTFTAITLGNGTVAASYQQIGKLVNVKIIFTLGSTSVVSQFPRMSIPVTAEANNLAQVGFATYIDTGTQLWWGICAFEDANNVQLYASDTSGTYTQRAFVSGTVPFTWTTGDQMLVNFSYKAA